MVKKVIPVAFKPVGGTTATVTLRLELWDDSETVKLVELTKTRLVDYLDETSINTMKQAFLDDFNNSITLAQQAQEKMQEIYGTTDFHEALSNLASEIEQGLTA